MIGTPTTWNELRQRTRAGFDGGWIVTLTLNVDEGGSALTLYLADTTREFGNARVHGIVRAISEFGRSVNIRTMRFNPAHAIVELANPQYWPRDVVAEWSRWSDKYKISQGAFPGLIGAQIKIGVHPGSYGSSSVGQILNVYYGTVTRIRATPESLILYTDDQFNLRHRLLPQRKFTRALFPKMPMDTEHKTMPLLYGYHHEQEVLRKTGFAPATRIDTWTWLVADHVIDAFPIEHRHGATGVQGIMIWIDELQSWAKSYLGVTFNVNNSGRATFTIDPDAAAFDVYLYPAASYSPASGTDPANLRAIEAATDYDAATKLSVIANTTTQAEITFEWRQQGDESDSLIDNSIAEMPGYLPALYGFQLYGSRPGAITISSINLHFWEGSAWVPFGSPAPADLALGEFKHYEMPSNYAPGSVLGTLYWHMSTGYNLPGRDGKPFKVRIQFNGSGWTADTTVVAYIHEARWVSSCRMPRDSATVVGFKMGPRYLRLFGRERFAIKDIGAAIIGASVQGREYGSWIDNGGRTNSYNVNGMIGNAPGIIESILRDELGVTTDKIDQVSFDTMYNDKDSSTGYNIREAKLLIPAGSSESSRRVLDTLCFEHAMMLVIRPNTQWRLMKWTGSGELVDTLKPDDLDGQAPLIDTTDLNEYTNQRTYYYNRMSDMGNYLRSVTQTPTTNSDDRYGVIPGDDIQLRSISAIIASTPILKMLDTQSAMEAMPHKFARFTTHGFVHLAAELGDNFRFSNSDFGPILRLLGDEWTGVDFMIYDIKYLPSGIAFECIKWSPD